MNLNFNLKNNELIPMTRRYPNLKQKVLKRDSVIAQRMINAWDVEHDADMVLSIFLRSQQNLSDERYWELMRTAWILCGSLKTVGTFRTLMQSKRPQRFYFSTPEEAKKLREMPEVLQVYRATDMKDGEYDNGISWTLSRDYAEWYKQTYCKNTILEKQVPKDQVFAFIERNNESEIIIL